MRKCTSLLFVATAAGLALTSCSGNFMSNLRRPLEGGNALDPPGYRDGMQPLEIVQATGPTYSPGQWVETTVPDAALYSRFPKEGDQPVRTMVTGTPLKVVSMEGTYARVELESGAIGFVPAIMVSAQRSGNEIPIVPMGPSDFLPPTPLAPGIGGLAPEPEIAPLSVEDATGVPPTISPIDPAADTIE